jgi:hypothetical protein
MFPTTDTSLQAPLQGDTFPGHLHRAFPTRFMNAPLTSPTLPSAWTCRGAMSCAPDAER